MEGTSSPEKRVLSLHKWPIAELSQIQNEESVSNEIKGFNNEVSVKVE
jgi:hypothetical protein